MTTLPTGKYSRTALDQSYRSQGRHRLQTDPNSTESPQDTDSTDPLQRPIIQRVTYVFDKLIEALPDNMRGDWRYGAVKTVMKESIKDIAMVPDSVIVPMMREFAAALAFVADGDMDEIIDPEENGEDGNT